MSDLRTAAAQRRDVRFSQIDAMGEERIRPELAETLLRRRDRARAVPVLHQHRLVLARQSLGTAGQVDSPALPFIRKLRGGEDGKRQGETDETSRGVPSGTHEVRALGELDERSNRPLHRNNALPVEIASRA